MKVNVKGCRWIRYHHRCAVTGVGSFHQLGYRIALSHIGDRLMISNLIYYVIVSAKPTLVLLCESLA